jgi:hypothetical protein
MPTPRILRKKARDAARETLRLRRLGGAVLAKGTAASGGLARAVAAYSAGMDRAEADTVPRWLSTGEHVLSAKDVEAMGGRHAVYAFREALHNINPLDPNTAAGRENRAVLIDFAETVIRLAGDVYEVTGSFEPADAIMRAGRERFIAKIAKFGRTGRDAEHAADDLGLIPEWRPTSP